jgi:hypothetical protein
VSHFRRGSNRPSGRCTVAVLVTQTLQPRTLLLLHFVTVSLVCVHHDSQPSSSNAEGLPELRTPRASELAMSNHMADSIIDPATGSTKFKFRRPSPMREDKVTTSASARTSVSLTLRDILSLSVHTTAALHRRHWSVVEGRIIVSGDGYDPASSSPHTSLGSFGSSILMRVTTYCDRVIRDPNRHRPL